MRASNPSIIEHILTIPQAQTKIFDLEWQSAFYTVFHQTKTSKLLHTVCMAPIVFSLFALASYVDVSSVSLIDAFAAQTAFNGAFIAMLVFAIWYLIMDVTIGLVSLPIVVAFWLLANVFNSALGANGVYVALGTLFLFSFIQTVSHQPESVPPPHSGSNAFVPFGKWMQSSTLPQKIKVFFLFPVFTLVELISAPRLLPVQILRLMHRLGYKQALAKLTDERAKRVLESGDYNAY
ncbi:MAG: YGL010W-like membrane protein [Bacteroidia bacterium]|jgi:uncharacterized membrane protein YGL010W